MEKAAEKSATKPVSINVQGMTCTNCAQGVEKVLGSKGLKDVHADFASGEVSFFNPADVSFTEVKSTIEGMGYQVSETAPEEKKGLSLVEKKFIFCLLFTLPLFLHMFAGHDSILNNPLLQLILCLPVFITGVLHFGKSALGSIKAGAANMDVLIFTGSSAAFFYSLAGTIMYYGTHEAHNYLFYETAATIITLVLLGNVLEHRTVKQTTTAIRELSALQPQKALLVENGTVKEVDAVSLKVNDLVQVNEGDKIPADGVIEQGDAEINESMISGESLPAYRKQGDKVIAGTILVNGNLRVKVMATGSSTVLSRIIEMVKTAQRDKPPIQQLGDKVSAIFVPVVLVIAALTFLAWFFFLDATAGEALMNAVAVLVISCPCAMGLATPTAVMAGLGRAAKKGILIRGGSTLQTMADIKKVVFDKTGTLTTGDFKVEKIHLTGQKSEAEIKSIILALEQRSSHPLAKSLVKAFDGTIPADLSELQEIKGKGIQAKTAAGTVVKLGSYRFAGAGADDKYSLYLSEDDKPIASLMIDDELRPGVQDLISSLQKAGIRPVMLSGDRREKCERTARTAGIEEYYCEKLPDEKLALITTWSAEMPTAMVGDGINDAPALARSSVGVSLGSATQIAIQSAQVIILEHEDATRIDLALRLGKHTLITIKQNLFWAFVYNVVAIPIAAAGLLNPMVAAFSMAFSDVIVIGNSIRLKFKNVN